METFGISNELFEKYSKNKKIKDTERGILLTEFLEVINMSRMGTNFKPVSIAKIGLDVAHIPTKDLYYLLSICRDAGRRAKRYDSGFAKMFYYSIKVKKDDTRDTNSNSTN